MSSSEDRFDLPAELRALRPEPRPQFTAELDERAAAGFPSRRRSSGAFRHLADRFRIAPRRLMAPAAGVALATIAIATVVVINSEGSSDPGEESFSAVERPTAPDQGLLSQQRPEATGESSAGTALPAEPATSGAGRSGGVEMSDAQASSAAQKSLDSGPYAAQSDRRAVERSAELVLGTDPAEVRRAAGKVFDTVHVYDGIVLESSIEDGGEGEAGASFELLIPSAKLGDALASFSSIAEVRSRHESTADVTARTVGLGERLQDSSATVKSLLGQLAAADTEAERVVAEAELRSERLRVAGLRARLADLERRTNLSRVSLQIESGEAGVTPTDEGGSWGVGDALGDAGQILEVAAGVTLIGLAILAPVALLCLLAWLARRTTLRRNRERALS